MLLTVLASIAVPSASAKTCDLDLQVVIINAEQAFKENPAVSAADALTKGLFSFAFGGVGGNVIADRAASKVQEAIDSYGLAGSTRTMAAGYSGRPYGWYFLDPSTQVPPVLTQATSDSLDGNMMVVIHLDDPEQAATAVGHYSPVVVGLGKLFGADVRGKVYSVFFERMAPELRSAGLQAMVNTGQRVRCADVTQRY